MFSSNASQVSSAANYIEDVFSTWLYTGTGAAQTITNSIDLSTKGGMVWLKDRTSANPAFIMDTTRGTSSTLQPSTTGAAGAISTAITSFNTTGFTIGTNGNINTNTNNYVSWTFREQANFFDVVTYTGTGANRTVAHNLESVPGCIMVKRTDTTGDWQVYHANVGGNSYMVLNSTAVAAVSSTRWNNTVPTSTVFSLGTDATVNGSGGTYVAYLFADDAGGFGAAGTDNVITCGSYTGNGVSAGPTITLGYEPQWLLIKSRTGTTGNWCILDTMRGLTMDIDSVLLANSSGAELTAVNRVNPTSTGFQITTSADDYNALDDNYLYIAIRRGPMKTPTTGTSVFGLSARTGTGANATVTGGQIADAILIKNRGAAVADLVSSRLSGTGYLVTSSTAVEVAAGTTILQANPWDVMDGAKVGTTSTITNASANTFINYLFRRAPGYFDVVCYTGPGGTSATISHNLGVVPELMIVKSRSNTYGWAVYSTAGGNTKALNLSTTAGLVTSASYWNNTTPTSSVFSIGAGPETNSSGVTYIAYLFATVAGVSKVGSYTGTGTTKQIDCGFTGGARFVLIKRTDTLGDWYLWDSARGIVAGNDPYWLVNTSAAEITSTDYVDTYSAGFEISSTAPAAINANGGTFIFLAIA